MRAQAQAHIHIHRQRHNLDHPPKSFAFSIQISVCKHQTVRYSIEIQLTFQKLPPKTKYHRKIGRIFQLGFFHSQIVLML